MKMFVKFFILCGIAFYDAKIFCSEKKFGPVHVTRFASHVVDDTTHFDYPELEQGFAIVGQDFQQFMKTKLVGKDSQDQIVMDDESKSTALHDAIMQAQQIIVDECKDDVQKVLLDVADKKIDEDTIYNQKFNYVQCYKDVLQLDTCLYDWPVFKEGFDHLDEDEDGSTGFDKYINKNRFADQFYGLKESEKKDPAWTSSDYIFYNDGEIRLDFIYFILGAQSAIIDELQEKLSASIKNTIQNGGDLHDVVDPKMLYILKYVDVGFVREGLQESFIGNGRELGTHTPLIQNVLRADNLKMFDFLLTNKIIRADYQEQDGFSILLCACCEGAEKIVKKIIGQGVDVNKVGAVGFSALHIATHRNQYEVVQLLLDAGADVDFCDNYGRSVQDIIEDNKMENIFKLHAAKKILQEIDHIETQSEQDRSLMLQEGFALLGRDYQAIIKEQLAGRHPDEPTFDEDGDENDQTALEECFLNIEEILADDLHEHFMTTIAVAIENNSDINFQADSNLKYIYKYYDRSFILENLLSPDVYFDESLAEGFDVLDLDVKEFLQEKLGDNSCIVDKNGILNQEFKDIVHEAQEKIVNELETSFLSELQRCCRNHVSFDDVTDAKVRYLLDHKDVPFIKRALKVLVNAPKLVWQIVDPLTRGINDKNEILVKELLELGADASRSLDIYSPLRNALFQINYHPESMVKMHAIIQLLFDAGADMDEKNGPLISAWNKVHDEDINSSTLELFKQERKKEKYQLRDQAYRRKKMIIGLAGIIGTLNLMDLVASSKK